MTKPAGCKCQGFFTPIDCPVHGVMPHDQPVSQTLAQVVSPPDSMDQFPTPDEARQLVEVLDGPPRTSPMLVNALRQLGPAELTAVLQSGQAPPVPATRPPPNPYPPRDIDVNEWETLNRHHWWTALTPAQQAELWNEALPRLIERVRDLEQDLHHELEEAESSRMEAQSRASNAEEELSSANGKLNELRTMRGKLEAELEEARSSARLQHERAENLQLDNAVFAAANTELRTQLNAAQALLAEARARITELTDQGSMP